MDQLTRAQSILAAQPFSKMLGTQMTAFGEGKAELELPLTDAILQQHGFVHGGVTAYLADCALAFAGGSVLGDILTAEFKINYTAPAKGETLVARGSVIHSGRKLAVCEARIFAIADDTETLVAIAQGTISAFSKSPKS